MSDGMMGLRHAALAATDLARATAFYRDVLGFEPYYEGDDDWTMLRRGTTSISLVRVAKLEPAPTDGSHPAHLGLTFDAPQSVDGFHRRLVKLPGVAVASPRWHRDKSYGFYFQDSEGNNLEAIFIPAAPIVGPRAIAISRALVFFAAAGGDPGARRPYEELQGLCRRHFPHTRFAIGYRDAGTTLDEAIEAVFEDDTVTEAVVVPLFFAARADVPAKAGKKITVAPPVGLSAFFQHGLLETVAEALVAPR